MTGFVVQGHIYLSLHNFSIWFIFIFQVMKLKFTQFYFVIHNVDIDCQLFIYVKIWLRILTFIFKKY